MKRAGKILMAMILILLGIFVILESIVLFNAHDDADHDAPVMIVLGAMVWPNGPSPALRHRLDKALDYLADHPEVEVIVSGGQGGNEPCSEARCMADYLIAAGFPPEQVHLEDGSFNTRQNLNNARDLMAALGYDPDETRVVIVSSGFHLARVRMLADRYGLIADTLAAPFPERLSAIYSYCREAPALVKSFLFD